MKVALVSPYDWATPGGVNVHVRRLAHELRIRGHEAVVLAPSSDEVNDPGVVRIGRPITVPAAGSMVRITLNPRIGRQVREVLEEHKFDIVHVHEPLVPFVPIQVLRYSRASNPDVVNVGTFHARRDGGSRMYEYGRHVLKRWFREIDGKIAVSPPAAQYVGAYFPGFYNIIPNGIDVDHWENPAIEPVPEFQDGLINILYVGRAEKRKGLGYMLRAFGMVNARNPHTRLIVVGPDSRARRRYQASVERSGQRNVVWVTGPSYDELPRYHHASHIFCSPATQHESQGYVLLEAMSASVPVVATNIDGYASVLTHEVDGLLVQPRNAAALANALTRLVRDADLRASLAAAGRKRVEIYSWPVVTQQLLSYYERLLDDHRAYRRFANGAPHPRPARGASDGARTRPSGPPSSRA